MDAARKKELAAEYKKKQEVGGVYLVENTESGRCLLRHAADLAGAENRFRFARATGGPLEPRLRDDWGDGSAFRFVTVDTLEKKEDWDAARFQEELKALAALWKEQLAREWY